MMRNLILISLIILFVCCSGGNGNLLREDPPLSHVEWAKDLNALANELPQRHVNVFHTVSRSDFDSKVAAMTNAVDFRREFGAILVGEPTGARPNQYQESGNFTLPNSGLRITVSTRYYQFQEG